MKRIKLIALMLIVSVASFAQGPGFDPDVEPYATPISDDIWVLAAAGLVLGALKFRKMRMKVA
jgi:hypothetical protein